MYANSINLYLHTEPFSLDPRIGVDRRSQLVLRTIYEGLTRISKQGTVELALARSVEISDDQCIYTFYLHDAYWSDKTKIRAQDFEKAWKSCIDPSLGATSPHLFFVIKNAQKAHNKTCSLDELGIHALDDTRLEISLSAPVPYFLELLSNPLFSPLPPSTQVSNGPFIIKTQLATYILAPG